jgi:DNA sulfur modification protein DndC
MPKMKQPSLFESQRDSMRDAIDLSIASLNAYGDKYRYWCIAYSGGKDSSATVSFVRWAIRNGFVKAPEKLFVLYADTRQELTPLWTTADRFLTALRAEGVDARMVKPALDDRFYVYMFGRGVPPPSNTFRWCTAQLKIEPMEKELAIVRDETGEKFLQLTGVRKGESAARDARIAVSCSTKDGECGQGWFQARPSTHVADTLAPLIHWRQCYVWDWLYDGWSDNYVHKILDFPNAAGHGYEYLGDIAAAYGDDDARTGCIGCNLASRDVALENIVKTDEWAHLTPLLEIKPLFKELKKPQWRLRKASPELKKDGSFGKNGQRLGPLTMAGREYGLERILDIQRRARVDLINAEEEARIRDMWILGIYPQGWEGGEGAPNHVIGDVPLDSIAVVGDHELIVQRRML